LLSCKDRPCQLEQQLTLLLNMKINLLVLCGLVVLSGCVVTTQVIHPVPLETQVVYPRNEGAYVWDPVTASYYFVYSGRRHDMHRGWHPRQGYPRHHYEAPRYYRR
jgi:hypothetical protein